MRRTNGPQAVVTMQQVADRANVSISTVSFVVNDTKPVSPDTRARILEAIDELGYRRNAAARTLASRRSRVVALMYPFTEHHLSEFVTAAATASAALGYRLILWPTHGDDAASEVTSLVKSGIADGALLMEVKLEDERVAMLRDAHAPFVLMGRTRDTTGIDFVDVDFETTTAQAVAQLAELGHRNVALVVEDNAGTPLAGHAPAARTEQTFLDEAAARGLGHYVARLPRGPAAGRELVDLLVRDAPDTTAVISLHNDANFGLVNTLRHRSVQVPRDLSIVAICAPETLGELCDPPITTYPQPAEELGRQAAEALIARLHGSEGVIQQLIPCARPSSATSIASAPRDRPPLGDEAQ
ncbi:MAG TPA: LacI family DNA-binding transcriptional regulator [Microbacterium sp.]|uniref:LacI family DNA-binding transcriptional regulator n=1 Tax=Microbacterium sp. TaxID=51671 RepID=UPI002B48D3BD|nr:LacI family DNA-binding transcriptional regulator [Microbacterium sp.]HKT58042.1 LacI family DNA-binding transcriptional regulator [Microbacterium sp.]